MIIIIKLLFNLANLDEKKAIRDRRARDEQRIAKRIEERNSKKQLPLPKWHDRSLFPDCGYDPFADKRYLSYRDL